MDKDTKQSIQLTPIPTTPVCAPGEVLECNINGDPNLCACMATRKPTCTVGIIYNPQFPEDAHISVQGAGCEAGIPLALASVLAALLKP